MFRCSMSKQSDVTGPWVEETRGGAKEKEEANVCRYTMSKHSDDTGQEGKRNSDYRHSVIKSSLGTQRKPGASLYTQKRVSHTVIKQSDDTGQHE